MLLSSSSSSLSLLTLIMMIVFHGDQFVAVFVVVCVVPKRVMTDGCESHSIDSVVKEQKKRTMTHTSIHNLSKKYLEIIRQSNGTSTCYAPCHPMMPHGSSFNLNNSIPKNSNG